MRNQWVRGIAAAAGCCGVLGAAGVAYAVAAFPHPWYAGYISEAGVASSPRVGVYRVGVVGIALALVLLGTAMRRMLPLAAGLLLVGGAFAGLSATVSCSPGCPLPPYEHPTLMDWLHGVGATTAVGLATLAMIAVGWKVARSGLRRMSMVWFAVAAPPTAAMAVALLAIGRGTTTAVLERISLVIVLGWVVTVGFRIASDGGD